MASNRYNILLNKNEVFNSAYIPSIETEKRYEILFGGAGAGKSVFVAQRMIYRHLKTKGYRTLVVRKVGNTHRLSTFLQLRGVISEWQVHKLFETRKTDMEIRCRNGNSIHFVGLDDVEKLKSIAGITDIWIEEASEITQDDFTQLDLRLRGAYSVNKQITLTFNPISAYHWIKTRFFDFPSDNTAILKTTYKDNRFIDDDYKRVLEALREQDESYYQIYALGNWGTPKGLIYSNYALVAKWPQAGAVSYGIDFGFNNPTAMVEVKEYDGETYVRERLYQTHMTNSELIEQLKIMKLTGFRLTCDSAEPNRIQELRAAGFNAHPANKDVKKGIDAIRSCRLKVDAGSANLVKELQGYKWREDRNGSAMDEPVKFQDHLMDAMRYCIYTGTKSDYTAW